MIEEMKIFNAIKRKIEGSSKFKSSRFDYRTGSVGFENNDYES
jgi:hypothetical protein